MAETQHDPHHTHQALACDGGVGALGHPKVYLKPDQNGKAVCPYCSKTLTRDTAAH